MVFALACSGIYKSEDSDFQNILNLESSACFSPFLSFFFFFFLSYYYYFTSDFTIIDLLFFKYSTISSLSMPSTCKFYKNSSNSASFPIPNAFLSFFFNFFYFFSYFWALFFFYFFRPFSDLSSSDDSIRAFLIYSCSSSEDDEDCGMARSSSSLTHRLLSSQFFRLLFFFLVTAASVYLLSSFLFRSASLIRNNLQQICDFLFNQELRFYHPLILQNSF